MIRLKLWEKKEEKERNGDKKSERKEIMRRGRKGEKQSDRKRKDG